MMAMVKIVLLLLVVFKATALENSHETDSNHELFPYPPQSSTGVDEQKQSTVVCAVQCVLSCKDKKSFQKAICIGKCLAKCAISPSDSLDDISCTLDCAQSSTDTLRYDASLMNDRISSCHQQCKRD